MLQRLLAFVFDRNEDWHNWEGTRQKQKSWADKISTWLWQEQETDESQGGDGCIGFHALSKFPFRLVKALKHIMTHGHIFGQGAGSRFRDAARKKQKHGLKAATPCYK
jgi:hypothetical protein